MQKNPQTRVGISWNFTDLHGVMQVQIPTFTQHGNFNNGVANPKYGTSVNNVMYFAISIQMVLIFISVIT